MVFCRTVNAVINFEQFSVISFGKQIQLQNNNSSNLMKCMFCNRTVLLYMLLLYLLQVSREPKNDDACVVAFTYLWLCHKLLAFFSYSRYVFFLQIFANETETTEALSGFALIEVGLININDNEPIFNKSSYNFTYDEEIPVGFVIGTVTVCLC